MLLLAKEGVGNDTALLAAFIQTALILLLPALLGLFFRPVALYASDGANITQ
jgi:predicted Na+-dependent transporter